MHYWETPPQRPPTEAYSLLIRATRNCPWRNCRFCSQYGGEKLEIRLVEEVKNDIRAVKAVAQEVVAWAESIGKMDQINVIAGMNGVPWLSQGTVKNVFIGDADSLIMKTDDLEEILQFLSESFPNLERVTTYARAKTIYKKSLDDLKKLRKAGLSRLHVGLESGDDAILKELKKGATAEEMIRAGHKALEAGFELSEYVMPGLGGVERWESHARETACVLNRIDPHFIRLRTLNLAMVPDAPLSEKARRGEFTAQPLEGLVTEVRTLVEELKVTSLFVGNDFAHNYYLTDIDGTLPEDRGKMLKTLDTAMEWILSKHTV